MRIERMVPQPPPQFSMHFTQSEGWAIVAALKEYAENHERAQNVKEWQQWAQKLDGELRR